MTAVGKIGCRTLALSLLAGGALAQGEDTLARVRRSGVLWIGAVPSQPPYSWKDLGTGEWRGFLPEIARDLAAGLGARVEPAESSWGNGVIDLETGKVDIFFGLAPTAQLLF